MSDESVGQGGQGSESQRARIDEAWPRFEAAWQAGQPPRIEDFLPAESRDQSAATQRSILVDLVGIDLDWRWKTADTAVRNWRDGRVDLLAATLRY